MTKVLVTAAGLSTPRGAYSPAVRIDLGSTVLLWVTGQLALDPAGRVVAPFDAVLQTEYIFGLLGTILAEAGMTLLNVVRAQTYLTDISDYHKFAAVRDRYFADSRPASTLLEVKGLAHAGCCVEIEVTAVMSK